MARNDFDTNNEEYDVVYDEEQKKGFFSKQKKETKNEPSNNIDNIMISNVVNDNESDNAHSRDFPSINNNPFNSSNILYEEKTDMTPKERVKEFLSTINKTALIAIASVVFAVLVIIIVIVFMISKENNSYKAEIIIPDIVYMGETSEISVNSKYTGHKKAKKDVKKTITSFEVKDSKVLSVMEQETTGSEILNTLVPVQEGRSKVTVISKLNNKKIGEEEQEVVVCPSLDTDLLLSKQIALVTGTTYNLKIDFGEEECAQGITYESSNEEIATVSSDGIITGVSKGKAILTIKKGIKSVSTNLEVTDQYVGIKSFKVIPTMLQLSEGEKYRLKIDYAPVNATSFNTSFYSSDGDIVKVSEGGLVEAVSEGSTTIKVNPPNTSFGVEVKVVVTKGEKQGEFATDMSLNKNAISLVQGKSEKIIATLTPENISNKVVSWKSSDTKIATVDRNGIIYGKAPGTTEVTASTNNGLSKTVKVTVEKIKTPTITSSDGIATNTWHTKPYVLTFSSTETGIEYFYGTSENKVTSTGKKITVNKDESKTYYVKACTRICTQTCTDKKDKNGNIVRDDNGKAVQVCTSKCSEKPSTCSDAVTYISKLDITKPQVVTVAGIEKTPVKTDTVQIALKDNTSLVQKWCVTTQNNSSTCKWSTIQTSTNPVVDYTATKNGTYYAFAKDTAGNISDSLKFEITNIE